MDVIERTDCDSSAESDVSEVSDGLSIVSNDDDLEPPRESDVTTTSTITTSMRLVLPEVPATQRLMEFPCLVC